MMVVWTGALIVLALGWGYYTLPVLALAVVGSVVLTVLTHSHLYQKYVIEGDELIHYENIGPFVRREAVELATVEEAQILTTAMTHKITDLVLPRFRQTRQEVSIWPATQEGVSIDALVSPPVMLRSGAGVVEMVAALVLRSPDRNWRLFLSNVQDKNELVREVVASLDRLHTTP